MVSCSLLDGCNYVYLFVSWLVVLGVMALWDSISVYIGLSWRREGCAGMGMWNAPTVQSRQPLTYGLMENVGLRGPRWLGGSWQRGTAENGSSQLSTLMTETPGDLVPCRQQESYLEGGPLMGILPLYLHVNKKSEDDDDVSQRKGERRENWWMREKMSKQSPPAPTASAVGPCTTIFQISRTPPAL